MAEYPANGATATPQKEYGYRNGQLLITAGGVTSGLVGHWKLDENTGTSTADSSGSGNAGTLSAGAAWATGQSGSAASLDGADDYVQVGAKSSLVMTSTASFSAWIYPTGPGSEPNIGGTIVNKEGEYEIVRFPNGTIQMAFANSNPGWNWINTGYVAPLNEWTHVAVTYSNGTVKTYANGNLVHTYNGSGSIGDVVTGQNDFRIGGRQQLSQNFQGRIDEVRVYNRTVTAGEVIELMGAPVSGLKGHWKLNENTGASASDSSGSGNTGTLTSGAGWGAGQSGSAANLDGVDDYVQVGAQPSLAMTSTASFSAWIYPTGPGSMATYGGVIVSKEGEYEIARFQDGTIQWAFANSNPGWAWVNTGYVAPLNEWTHLTITYSSGTIKTYANGNLVHTYNGSGSIGDVVTGLNDFRIGSRQEFLQNFQGRIDDVRVYNRAITAGEVSSVVTAGAAVAINWLVSDHLGTPRMIIDQTGTLGSMKRHDYLPFGEELFAPAGGRTSGWGYSGGDAIRQQFTSKERDVETGLDFFEARYYQSVQGRFISPDPLIIQEEMLSDPQRFNLYGYVRNTPLNLIDPTGEAIELIGDDKERARKLELLRKVVGKEAGAYLYENKGKDGKYYVGIYTNGPDGKGKDFGSINASAGNLVGIIKDRLVAEIQFFGPGDYDKLGTIGADKSPGATGVNEHGRATILVLDPSTHPGFLPGQLTSNERPLAMETSDVLAHELGHVASRWGLAAGSAEGVAIAFENDARKVRDPNTATRESYSRKGDLKTSAHPFLVPIRRWPR